LSLGSEFSDISFNLFVGGSDFGFESGNLGSQIGGLFGVFGFVAGSFFIDSILESL
jgi:hypothetical protein